MKKSLAGLISHAVSHHHPKRQRRPLSKQAKKVQGNRICLIVEWMMRESARRGVNYRLSYLEALTIGINQMGWKMPDRLLSTADPGE